MPTKKSRGSSRAASSSRRSAAAGATSRTSRKNTAKRKNAKNASSTPRARRAARPLTDHEEIQSWAEHRGAVPSCVKGTGRRGDVGMIRLDFPGYSGEESLQEISWDEWFEKFDESGLALMVQDETAAGKKSNFNKLVKRTAAQKPRRARAGS